MFDGISKLMQGELAEFAELYEEYEALLDQQRIFAATIGVLSELEEWRNSVNDVDSALNRGDLQSTRAGLEKANVLFSKLETQGQMIALLPRMKLKLDTLTAGIKDAFVARWDEMVLVRESEEGVTLSVTEDSECM